MVFNNGDGRMPVPYSTVDVIAPPLDSLGHYVLVPGMPYGPDSASWTYTAANPTDFYSKFIGGAQQLSNGHVAVCDGTHGTLFEVDTAGKTVWKYVCPMTLGGLLSQGDTVPSFAAHGTGNWVFRISKYPPGYPGFTGKTLMNTGPLELNPWPAMCFSTVPEMHAAHDYRLYPNPTPGALFLAPPASAGNFSVSVYDLSGRRLQHLAVRDAEGPFPFRIDDATGVYLVRVTDGLGNRVFRVVRQ